LTPDQQAAIDATTAAYAATDPALAPVCDASSVSIGGTCVNTLYLALGIGALFLFMAKK
jgi:hypothetical protein